MTQATLMRTIRLRGNLSSGPAETGSSLRAGIMARAAKVRAVAQGRDEVSADDLRAVAPAVLRHRLILNFEGRGEEIRPDLLIDGVLDAILGPSRGAGGSPSDG